MSKEKDSLENKEVKVKIEENKLIDHGFFTEIPTLVNKKEEKKKEIEKKPILNNIHLGEIPKEVLNAIKYPCIVRAFFYALDYSICYRIQKDDDIKSALTILREAIFNAAMGKELPKYCYVQTGKAYFTTSAFILQNSVSLTEGVIDARIEAFECGIE